VSQTDPAAVSYHQYLQGGGEMGELTRRFDWSATVLGSPDQWPQSLLTTISILLNSRFPMFLWWGTELIQFYNDAYRLSLGDEGKHPLALGQKGEACWPEIWPVIKPLIDQVMAGGESTWSEDQLIPIYRNGQLEDVYWTFSYSRVNDESGKPGGVLVICNETTNRVKILEAVQESQRHIAIAKAEAERQYDRLKRFFMEVPAGICILNGPDMIFEMINPSYQELFPGRELLGKPLMEALPELEGQRIWGLLQDVYNNDKTFEGNALYVPLARQHDGPVEDRYFNFIYQTRHNIHNEVDGILVFVFEVTDIVLTKNDLEKAQDTLQFALLAAELGTFDLDLENDTLDWNTRCRALFGITHHDTVTYEKDFMGGLHPDDRDRIREAIAHTLNRSVSNGDYDVEYRTIGVEDEKIRWVRAKGKAYFDGNDKAVRLVGAALDITEQKSDELRKNDFIGMVSHELKTPLTSINAYVQLLMKKAMKLEDDFMDNALDKVNQQIKRMTAMINGFLNISRLEAGKIHLDKQDFDIEQLVRIIIEETQMTTTIHNIEFSSCKPIVIHADQNKIGAVISNLLSNAVKYSPKGKNIIITCELQEDHVRVSIKDEGMGIKAQDIEKLFNRFYRIETKHTEHISGFGIGLYLSAEIIRHHNGRIWVESQSGIGSTFYFTLPLSETYQPMP
jgi:two-component system sensor histidine kinase VicK